MNILELINTSAKNNEIDIDWCKISKTPDLTEEFIEANKDEVDWKSITINQKLSESFIEKYTDKLNW